MTALQFVANVVIAVLFVIVIGYAMSLAPVFAAKEFLTFVVCVVAVVLTFTQNLAAHLGVR